MRNGKKVVITYGTYDLLHFGHIALLERAKALGDYLIVGVTSDAFDKARGKLNVAQPLAERLLALHEAGIADEIVVEEYQGQKIDDIKRFGVDIFAIGSDWEGRFDYLKRYCDVVYLERTKGVSSTELRASRLGSLTIGCIGSGYIMGRFLDESKHVAAANIVGGFAEGGDAEVYEQREVPVFESRDELLAAADAVYIVSSVTDRAAHIEAALQAGCHVLCETPAFLTAADCKRLQDMAASRDLVFMEALKTLYFPAFQHLKVLIESGVIGEVKDIDASFSHVFDELDRSDRFQGSFYDMAGYITLPAMSLLGSDFTRSHFLCRYEGDFCTWAKLNLMFSTASATLRVGRGMKTEGDMTITGTEGYVYVPAPWWKPDYFEIRKEDLRETKRYFYDYAGQGQRYELFEFVRLATQPPAERVAARSPEETVALSSLVESFDNGGVDTLVNGAFAFGGGETVTDR